jgi:uncharacterized protein
MTATELETLLSELKQGLLKLYGNRLKGVYLYGSYARGDHSSGSDVDIMIVLDNYQSYWQELVYSGELISSLSLKYGLSISRVVIKQQEWQKENTPLLRNIRAEGIAA